MLPKSVMCRRDITPAAKLVLSAMSMESCGTGRVAISDGALGLLAGCTRTTALVARTLLVGAKLIEKDGPPIGQVQPYKILHPRLVSNPESTAKPQRATPKTIPPIRCPRCERRCRALLKIGYCRMCRWDEKVDRRIDAKILRAKTA